MNSLKPSPGPQTLARADVYAVLVALIDEAVESLANGNQISFGKLGSIAVNLKSEGSETEDRITTSLIIGAMVIYRPGPEIKGMLNNLKFEKAS